MFEKPKVILCAAVKMVFKSTLAPDCATVEYYLVGARHYDTLMRLQKQAAICYFADDFFTEDPELEEQGFLDQEGKFYNREQAWELADAMNQIYYPSEHSNGVLYSENLY
jgi:hypothetical protein